MIEIKDNRNKYLLPGELIVTKESIEINTILGSCVSVCLYEPDKKIAGMNHYLLPINTNNDPDHFRYGNTSLAYMVNRMISLGANTSMMSAHVFGGSSMFSHTKNHFNIGHQNTEIALDFLKQNRITIKLCDTGGKTGRKIVFYTGSGIIEYKLIGRKKQ